MSKDTNINTGKNEDAFFCSRKFKLIQHVNYKKRDRKNVNSNNTHVGKFIYPIANYSFNSKSSDNLLYRMKYPEKPLDQTKLINFISNKGVRHSYSSKYFIDWNDATLEQKMTTLSFNNTFKSSKHFDQNNLKPLQPYSNAERNFYKNNLRNEMRHRSLMTGRLPQHTNPIQQHQHQHHPPIRKKSFHQIINESEKEDIDNDQFVCQEKSNIRIRKRYQKLMPQIKIMEQNLIKWKVKSQFNIDENKEKIAENRNNKIRHINPNKRFLKKRDFSIIKMTASYVRDLKIIAAVNKIKDPRLALELKRRIVGDNDLSLVKN